MSDAPRPGSYAPYQTAEPEQSWGETYRHASPGSSDFLDGMTDVLGDAENTRRRLRIAMIQVRMDFWSAQLIVLCCLLPAVLLAYELFLARGPFGGAWTELAPAAFVLCVFATVAAAARMLALFAKLRELYACMDYLRDALSGATVDVSMGYQF